MVKGTRKCKSSRGYSRVISIPQLPFGDSTMKPTLTLKRVTGYNNHSMVPRITTIGSSRLPPKNAVVGKRGGGGGLSSCIFVPFFLLQKISTWAPKISTLNFQTPSLHSVLKACLHKRQQKVVWKFGLGFLMVITLGGEKSMSQFKILVVGHNVKWT